MKRPLILLILLLCAPFLFSCDTIKRLNPFAKEEVPDNLLKRLESLERLAGYDSAPKEGETAIFTGHPDYPPIMWCQDGELVGVGLEILRAVIEDNRANVETRCINSWQQAQDMTGRGYIDFIVGTYKRPAQEKLFDYSIPYMQDHIAIFVKKGNGFPYEKWEDLIDKKGVTTAGDSYGREFDNFMVKRLTVSRLGTPKECFETIIGEGADYFIYPLYLGLAEAERFDMLEGIEYLPKYIASNNVHIAVSKRSKFKNLLPDINLRIEEMIKEGSIGKLITEKTKYYREMNLQKR
ncbi:MAG: transporter substrate-binding domain-containing protein [Syntrophorhabdaceae bacterium]|nr:transporter substrate-binding domain-containing protein [Syntrophorhabdaceae bacterium]